MRIITGLFDTYAHAAAAVHALRDAGIGSADISLIANSAADLDPEPDAVGEGATAGAELGAVLGGAGGVLAGLGVLAIPGIGPVIAGGWLFATAMGAVAGAGLGAATGGLIGALTHAGVPEADAHVYADSVRRGGALVTVRAEEHQMAMTMDILRRNHGVDVAERRRRYEEEGWTGFDPAAPPPAADDPRDQRERQPFIAPPV